MSHLRRIVLMAGAILSVIVLIVFLTRVAAPLFDVADGLAIGQASSPFNDAYWVYKQVGYILIVPIFLIGYFAYMVLGPAQDELQRERRRRQP